MNNLFDNTLPSIKRLIKDNNFSAKKSLGQNYVIDQSITDKIVKSVGNLRDKLVIDVGAGVGTLTRSILKFSDANAIIAIEKDVQFKNVLDQLRGYSNNRLNIVFADALKFDLLNNDYINDITYKYQLSEIAIIANLPYNIGTRLITQWLDMIYKVMCGGNDARTLKIASITVMLQLEVADRLIAYPKTKAYGLFSVLIQWLCNVEKLFTIPPEVFWPVPKVKSAVMHIKPKYGISLGCSKKQLMCVCEAAFKMRRKKLKNSLKMISLKNPQLIKYLEANPNIRPEEISIRDFEKIASMIDVADG